MLVIENRSSEKITGLNRTSESKVIVIWFFLELQFSITSVSIYYRTQSDIRIKNYCRLILLIASAFNFKHVDILQDTIGDPRKNLMSFEFSQSFHFQFRVSRYITGLHRTSVLKVIVIWICYELLFSISSVLIYYGTQSDIRVKRYCRLNLLRDFIINYERLDILQGSIRHPS